MEKIHLMLVALNFSLLRLWEDGELYLMVWLREILMEKYVADFVVKSHIVNDYVYIIRSLKFICEWTSCGPRLADLTSSRESLVESFLPKVWHVSSGAEDKNGHRWGNHIIVLIYLLTMYANYEKQF